MNDKKFYYPKLHIMPPQGWLNDPNGLSELHGIHHIFFQYSPEDPKGGQKYWGHYETKDFLTYEYTGITISSDHEKDRDGVYSGSAYVEDDTLYLYYTGNVKEPGEYDYIYEGRGAATILVESKDGIETSEKKVVLFDEEYPERLSCHVRDPKVFSSGKDQKEYAMVLGARTMEDKGCILCYGSKDKIHWDFEKYMETKEPFGYMWECPDLFTLDGQQILSLSPQGLESQEYCYQNMYQSGYFILKDTKEDIISNGEKVTYIEENFKEWDMGFDFYAPQTYLDEQGRRILFGWMGVPDAKYDHDPSLEEGWQHMLTLPRECTFDNQYQRVLQYPVKEIQQLRGNMLYEGRFGQLDVPELYELLLQDESDTLEWSLCFDASLQLRRAFDILTLEFLNGTGYGREKRQIKILPEEKIQEIRIIVDSSAVEIYINRGAYVMTTKHYPEWEKMRKLEINGFETMKCYELKEMKFNMEGRLL